MTLSIDHQQGRIPPCQWLFISKNLGWSFQEVQVRGVSTRLPVSALVMKIFCLFEVAERTFHGAFGHL